MRLTRMITVFIGLLGIYTNGALSMPVKSAADQPMKWNIISIVTDDQAVWAMGAYGNTEIMTPNMDRLAREGVRFTNCFVASGVCTPSRVSFLTGLYSTQVGVTDAHPVGDLLRLPPGVPTWPRALKKFGYNTGLIGKWHLGRVKECYPTNFGLDYFFGFLQGSSTPMDPILYHGDHIPQKFEGPLPDILTTDAIRFIEKRRDEPFALMLHYRAPHWPHSPVPEEDMEPFKDLDPTVPIVDPSNAIVDDDQDQPTPESIAYHVEKLKGQYVRYYASVHSVDRNLGRLLAKLDELNLTQNTIVLFTSDNGFLLGYRGLNGKSGASTFLRHHHADWPSVRNMYDLSLRVPLIVRWPGVVEPGTVIDELVSNIDTYPSILGMLDIPRAADDPDQGMDFSPLLRGEDVGWRDAIFGQYETYALGNAEFLRMIRTKKWKLVRTYLGPTGNQLFDLEKDPEEMNNLYYIGARDRIPHMEDFGQEVLFENPHAKVIEDLQNRLTAWQESIGDPVLEMERIQKKARRAVRERWQHAHRTSVSLQSSPGAKPNVVFILADSLGYGDTEPYGVPDIRTPSLNRMAREGVRLTNFYGNGPICTPTRAAFITGRYPQRAGMGKNVNRENEAFGLPASETSIARMLKDDGYATALFGKWHLGYAPEFNPLSHGFDEFFGILDWTVDYHSHKNFQGKPALFEGTETVEHKGYLTDLITERSVSFIEQNQSRPFFLYVAYNAVLPPYQRPDRADDIRGPGTWTRGTRKDYAQMVERVDYGVGRILDKLATLGLDKDTLVIFSSDHGGEELSRNAPFFHHFSTLWEGGIRVPCILCWPGRLPEGKVSHQVAATMDITASILSAAGIKPPEGRVLDGIDILPILTGDKPVAERTLFWRMDYPSRRQKAVRRGKWKYLRDAGIEFLYDLGRDPGERHNLASRHPGVFEEMKALVKEWEAEMERSYASREKMNDAIR